MKKSILFLLFPAMRIIVSTLLILCLSQSSWSQDKARLLPKSLYLDVFLSDEEIARIPVEMINNTTIVINNVVITDPAVKDAFRKGYRNWLIQPQDIKKIRIYNSREAIDMGIPDVKEGQKCLYIKTKRRKYFRMTLSSANTADTSSAHTTVMSTEDRPSGPSAP